MGGAVRLKGYEFSFVCMWCFQLYTCTVAYDVMVSNYITASLLSLSPI